MNFFQELFDFLLQKQLEINHLKEQLAEYNEIKIQSLNTLNETKSKMEKLMEENRILRETIPRGDSFWVVDLKDKRTYIGQNEPNLGYDIGEAIHFSDKTSAHKFIRNYIPENNKTEVVLIN